jgi:hypothetical protein
MIIQYHSRLVPEFFINPTKDRRWQLVEPFEFSVDEKHYIIPVGFWTDFATVPRVGWPLISPYDLGIGPVSHDYGYYTGLDSRSYWDKVFLACMVKDKIPVWKRTSAYLAVDLFAGRVWNRYQKEQSLRKLPVRKVLTQPQEGMREAESEWQKVVGQLSKQAA